MNHDEQHEQPADFQPDELKAILAEGEQSIQAEGTLDGDDAFTDRRKRRQERPAEEK